LKVYDKIIFSLIFGFFFIGVGVESISHFSEKTHRNHIHWTLIMNHDLMARDIVYVALIDLAQFHHRKERQLLLLCLDDPDLQVHQQPHATYQFFPCLQWFSTEGQGPTITMQCRTRHTQRWQPLSQFLINIHGFKIQYTPKCKNTLMNKLKFCYKRRIWYHFSDSCNTRIFDNEL